jgi:hypothetical protein
MGYERAEVGLAAVTRLRFYAWDLPVNLARMVGWVTLARVRMWRGVRVPAVRVAGGRHPA